MKEINKIALELLVPPTNFDGSENLWDLERLHEHTLQSVGLTGYTKELGDEITYKNNLISTQNTIANCYYIPDVPSIPLRGIVGLDESNFFKSIYQVCALLQQNWKTLKKYRHLSINTSRTHMLFPFKNYLNEKCLSNIGVWYGTDTFGGGFNMDKPKYKDSNLFEYFGKGEKGLMVILPHDNKAEFLNSDSIEIGKDYKLLSSEDFKNQIKIISDTTKIDDCANRIHKIEERIRVELAYCHDLHELWHDKPIIFQHPDDPFDFKF